MGRASSMLVVLFAMAAAGLHTGNQGPSSRQSLKTPQPNIASKNTCTFRAYEIQRCEAQSLRPATFLQINEILGADDSIKVNVRAQRPRAEFNSYQRLQQDSAWEVARLENEEALSITLNEADGTIKFAYGDMQWTDRDGLEEAFDRDDQAWCTSREMFEERDDWDCHNSEQVAPQERIIDCSFPCEKSERIELR